ncbi:hypothetical protein M0813_29494 [Anaeramoeba flamelloides]|uniref:BTB domain-containing protein n=1 Tax=Anaeramoeba flamelloides TaxID=1746091 RepID=A0ABQ8XPF4_9EUKA|nr:hypothetical protein M0813_29494 [Anaeramoeba flamelloides]
MNWLVFGQGNLTQIYSSGNYDQPTHPTFFKDKNVKSFCSSSSKIVAVDEEGKLFDCSSKTNFNVENETFESVVAGSGHYLALSTSGKCYSWGTDTSTGNLGHGKSGETLNAPKNIEALNDKNVVKLYCGNYFSMALAENGDLYGWGHAGNGDLGSGSRTNIHVPTVFHKGVEKAWTGFCWNTFIKFLDGKITGHGYNGNGSLGVGHSSEIQTTKEINLPFDNSKIKKMTTGYTFSFALTEDNELYGCGDANNLGMVACNTFKKHTFFNDKPVIDIACGNNFSTMLCSNGDIYVTGTTNKSTSGKPAKIQGKIDVNYSEFFAGYNYSIFTNLSSSVIQEDLLELLESEFATDFELGGKKVHKFWIKTRLGSECNQDMRELFSTFSKKDLQKVLEWIYADKLTKNEATEQLFQKYQINPKERTIENDLLKLYKDEDSKDFNILVRVDEDSDEDEEDVEPEEEEFDELPIHKFILIARSGLFRSMFKNIVQTTNEVKDFSEKSIESLEVFVKYLYTDILELTADSLPEFVIDDLSDAVQYFQLNEKSSLPNQIESLKKQLNL